MDTLLTSARQVLKDRFGYDSFRAAQEPVVEAALNGDDVLAVLRTGYGKSLTFQIPALMVEGTAIVVSPLISLMKDQVDDCVKHGIAATFVNSTLEDHEIEERYSDLVEGIYDLFYVAPERLSSRRFRETLAESNINFIVCDEAHCTSQWGHDFRIQYSKVWKFRKIVEESSYNSPPLIAVTATATVGIESSIAAACGLKEGYVRVVGDPIRPNLSYNLERPYVSSWTRLRQVAEDRFSRDGWHLVYVGTRNGAETAAEVVGEVTGKPVGFYHAGMSDEAREQTQNDFKSGKLKIICATNAFGMGIDVAQIRTVIHVGIPGSLESYVQETGRAGRDGLHSDVYLFADDYSEKLQWRFFDSSNPSIQLFEQVWAFMHKEPHRHVFRLTAKKFAEAIGHDNDAPVSTVLSIMDKHGLVHREYTGGDTPALVHIPSLRAHLRAKLDNREIAIVGALLTRAVRTGADGEAMLQIDKSGLQRELGLTSFKFGKAWLVVKKLDGVTIGKPFAGKSTMILKYGEALTDHLPVVDLEAKRVRDMKRLENMIAYTRTTDPKRFIRDYFTSGA